GSFDFSKFTTLTGEIDSKSLTFSSLTAADWNSDLDGNGQTLSKDWLEAAFTNHGVDVSGLLDDIVQEFILQKGQQRFSDPNITYVNEESGVIKFGLAGYFNASNLLKEAFGDAEILGTKIADLVPSSVQASELVKVEYEGKYSYFYSFSATDSGQILNGSTNSHTGNYEMSFPLSALVNPLGVALVSTPEPITNIVSLFSVSVCGLLATRRKLD
ncbi:MAG: PEP-CTERM sorting domain-containing protein, partial [Cyanobacteria bacterium J083]